jgi:glucosamine--fructose-6-phosphate aminotransferase (isomerizing)
MCGIVGVVSLSPESAGLALSCLENLEYRGYDSAGIASLGKEGITVVKSKGSVSELVPPPTTTLIPIRIAPAA